MTRAWSALVLAVVMPMSLVVGLPRTWAADPVAVITEITPAGGEIRVKAVDDAEWKAPKPLLALRPGDSIRVTGSGRVVIVLTGGRGAQTVTQANSPFTVVAVTAESTGTRGVVSNVTAFLAGQQRERTYQSLSIRSARPQPPVILGPRDTAILGTRPTFEWTGSSVVRYTVKLHGPGGLIWEQADLTSAALTYPTSAPALVAGTRYTWELETAKTPTQRAEFELVSSLDDRRIRDALETINAQGRSGYPATTVVVMRAGYLLQEGLVDEARRELGAAIKASPDESALYQLLGRVYDRIGLKHLAADAFDRADTLASGER